MEVKIEFLQITEREKDVCSLILEGFSRQEIAKKLCLSKSTVCTHLQSLFEATGTNTQLKLALYLLKYGIPEVRRKKKI